MDDGRQPLIGHLVTLQTPSLGTEPSTPLRFEVAKMFGLTCALVPLETGTPVPPAGAPVVVWFEGVEYERRLDAVVLDGSPPPGGVLVRLPKLPERREHERHYEKLRVSVQPIGQSIDETRNLVGLAMDLSVGGVRIWLRETLTGHQPAFLVIGLPDQPPVMAIGESVAESCPAEDGWHEVRFQFTTISEEERGRLFRYLRTQ